MEAHDLSAPARDTEIIDEQQLPSLILVLVALGAVAVAALVAVLVLYDDDARLALDPEGFAVFAPLYVAAQAIERALEPLASRLNPTNEAKDQVKQAREKKLEVTAVARALAIAEPAATTERGVPAAKSADIARADRDEATALHKLRRKKAERRVIWWAVASVAGLLLCGALGLGILEAMSEDTRSWKGYQHDIDIILTGLVIGAGTKPLHDLITRLEKAKDNADPATKPTDKLPGTPPR